MTLPDCTSARKVTSAAVSAAFDSLPVVVCSATHRGYPLPVDDASISHRIVNDVVVLDMRGHYDVPQFERALRDAAAADAFEAPMRLLLDARSAAVNPGFGEISRAVDVVVRLRESYQGRVDILVASDLHYGLSRIVAALAEVADIHVHVHRDPALAYAAVGLDEAHR